MPASLVYSAYWTGNGHLGIVNFKEPRSGQQGYTPYSRPVVHDAADMRSAYPARSFADELLFVFEARVPGEGLMHSYTIVFHGERFLAEMSSDAAR